MKKMSFVSDDFRISQENCEEGWMMPYTHYHVSHEVYVLERGERIVTIQDAEYIAKAHDATLFYSNVPHRSRGESAFSGICLHFSERYMDAHFSEVAKRQLMSCFKHKVISLSEENYQKIKYFADNFQVAAPDNFVTLAVILGILNRSVLAETKMPHPLKHKKSELILDYVNENYSYIKRIDEITEQFGVSENYVFQVFRKQYGMTPKGYINELRIRNACHKLKNMQNSVKQVSTACGFDSYEYFVRVFKKQIGCTPTEYREQEKKE